MVPTSLCVPSKPRRAAGVPVEETKNYLDLGEEATAGKDLDIRGKWPESGTPMKDTHAISSNC